MEEKNNSAAMVEEEDEIDLARLLRDILVAARRSWKLGVAALAVGIAAALLYFLVLWSPRYTASTTVVIQSATSAGNQKTSEIKSVEQIGATFSYIVTSGVLRDVVAQNLGVEEITSKISASAVSDTNLLTIKVTDPDPDTAMTVLQGVLEYYSDVAEYTLGATHLTVMDEAVYPTAPSNLGRRWKIAALCILACLLVYFAGLTIYALFRKTILSPDEMKAIANIPYMAGMPEVAEKKRSKSDIGQVRINKKHIPSSFVEAVRTMGNRLLADMEEDENRKVYLVTSTREREGKTTTAMNLAILLAHRGKRVMLVDLNFRNPELAKRLGVNNNGVGLADLIRGQVTFADIVFRYHKLKLWVIPGSKEEKSVTTWMSSSWMKKMLESCRRQADVVLIDTPDMGRYADATMLMSSVDGVLLVVRQDAVTAEKVEEVVGRISDAGAHIVGFVMNRIKGGGGAYGYGHTYGYGYGSYGYGSYGYGSYGYGSYGYGSYGYGSDSYGGDNYADSRYADVERYQQNEFWEDENSDMEEMAQKMQADIKGNELPDDVETDDNNQESRKN